MTVLLFLISLPLAVITLSSLLSVWDNRFSSSSVVRLIARLAVVCAFLWLVPPDQRTVFVAACATVLALHGVSYIGVRVLLRLGFITEKDELL